MTHDFDAVLNLYYAKARFYDADNRRFTAVDPILDPSRYDLREYVTDPMQLVQYLYVKNNAVNWIDLLGLIGTVSQLYVNGNKYDNVAILYDDSTWIKTSALESILKAAEITGGKIGYEPVVDVVTGAAPKPNSPYTIPKRGYYERGNTRVYFTELDGECHIQLRDIARLGDVENTLSWWNENGTPTAVLNSHMKDSPVTLIREGDQVYITIYAQFTGDANKQYDNVSEAYQNALLKGSEGTFNKALYKSDYTYGELIAQGVREHWSVTVNPNNYDDFGGYSSINVNVNVYGKTASVNGVITTGTPSKNQRYIIVKVNSTTPSSEALLASYFYEEISNTSKGGVWSINNTSTVTMYDHYTKFKTDANGNKQPYREEYTVTRYKDTAAHEFGHVLGLGDAYDVSWHSAANATTGEVPQNDMMRSNGTVTPNDIEMLLYAWQLNTWQEYVDSNRYVKSPAIRSY